MNKKINQKCQKINCQDILDKKFYPVWFFTNERIGNFFQKLERSDIKKVFSIGGGGDFAFSLLSIPKLNQIDEIYLCDNRQMAGITIDFKIALLKNLPYQDFLNLFLVKEHFSKRIIYKKIRKTLTIETRTIFDSIIENCKEDDLLRSLRKTGLWYGSSFGQIKNKTEYLPYLESFEKYQLLQKRLNKITIYLGDFDDNLKLSKDNYYDLIYASNILDSKETCPEIGKYLQTIREKLNKKGLFFVVNQENPKKMIKQIEENGFCIYEKEINSFNIIQALFGHYSFSFLLFRKH